ncbi:hypothetical protein [Mycobacteroides abscessus]|uniref:hypothetical protein n=1 Tax=Mycobacteroides abscessus TaxID=36809 RepID=UPI000402C517|nr:hypothetical protein [Mycobacteroides abscessus]MDO3267820.1 hypothetical protein [Mycobacteroides abscessus subsp. abscessus]
MFTTSLADAAVASSSIVAMSNSAYGIIAAVGGTFFLAAGIIGAAKNILKRGTGAALAALGGGVLISVIVLNLVAVRDTGNDSFHNEVGFNRTIPGPYGR